MIESRLGRLPKPPSSRRSSRTRSNLSTSRHRTGPRCVIATDVGLALALGLVDASAIAIAERLNLS